ncbi:phosphate ABC transporter permease subunit PstC [Nesterenkonia sp. Act20]|uniref:phosphate ABC transporter permease subunit PstC n=1 Tax=Nesterenkonia sp. Act20 TaxID=1483432 RepID=UPI001C495002
MSTTTRTDRPSVVLVAQSSRWGEKLIHFWLGFCALSSVIITVGIVLALFTPLPEFFSRVDFRAFFSADPWAPALATPSFGVWNIVVGTLNVTMYALIVAIPAGLGAAIYLSEFAGRRARKVLKPVLEVLEGVPTVAYGIFAFIFVTPLLRDNWPTWLPGDLGDAPGIFSSGAAGLVLGVMIIPTVASISEDAMSAVPRSLREGAYGLGSTRMQVATKVVVPAALSGIVAGFVLGVSRAIGETMVVLLAAGASPNLTLMPNESVLPMTAFIGRTATGDISVGTDVYFTIFAVGALLFTMTFLMNMISIALVRRFREQYE